MTAGSFREALLLGSGVLEPRALAELHRWQPPMQQDMEPLALQLDHFLLSLNVVPEAEHTVDAACIRQYAKTREPGKLLMSDGSQMVTEVGWTLTGQLMVPILGEADFTLLSEAITASKHCLLMNYEVIGVAGVDAFLYFDWIEEDHG